MVVQLDFSAAFDRVNHCDLLHKMISIGVGGQFLSIVLEFLCDKRQRVRLDGKVSASVDVVSRVPEGSFFRAVVVYIVNLQALPHC